MSKIKFIYPSMEKIAMVIQSSLIIATGVGDGEVKSSKYGWSI